MQRARAVQNERPRPAARLLNGAGAVARAGHNLDRLGRGLCLRENAAATGRKREERAENEYACHASLSFLATYHIPEVRLRSTIQCRSAVDPFRKALTALGF